MEPDPVGRAQLGRLLPRARAGRARPRPPSGRHPTGRRRSALRTTRTRAPAASPSRAVTTATASRPSVASRTGSSHPSARRSSRSTNTSIVPPHASPQSSTPVDSAYSRSAGAPLRPRPAWPRGSSPPPPRRPRAFPRGAGRRARGAALPPSGAWSRASRRSWRAPPARRSRPAESPRAGRRGSPEPRALSGSPHAHHPRARQEVVEPATVPPESRDGPGRSRTGAPPPASPRTARARGGIRSAPRPRRRRARPARRLPSVWPPVPWLRTKIRHGHHELPGEAEGLSDDVEARREARQVPPASADADRPAGSPRRSGPRRARRRDAGFPPGRESRRPTRRRRARSGAQTGAPHGSPGWTAAGVHARPRRRRGPLARVVHRWRHYSRPPGIIPGAAMIPVAEARARILADVAGAAPEETLPVARGLGRVLAAGRRGSLRRPARRQLRRGRLRRPGGGPRPGRPRAPPRGRRSSRRRGLRGQHRTARGAPHHDRRADAARGRHRRAAGARRERGRVGRASPRSTPASNVRARGEDVRAGTVVLRAGTVLRPQDLGLIASLGFAEVAVHRRPRVALLSTGDEVVEPGQPRRPGQIYDANRFSLGGMVEGAGAEALDLGIVPDVRERLRERLLEAAGAADVVLTSGGVSVGDYDLVKSVLGEIGGIDFWQVAMQPGRPLAVGRIGGAPVLRPARQPRRLGALLPPVRPAGALEAGRAGAARPRVRHGDRASSRCGSGRAAASSSAASSGSPTAAARSRPPGPRAPASSPRWSPPTASSSSRRTAATWRPASASSSSRSEATRWRAGSRPT